jgi:hypothetical protein
MLGGQSSPEISERMRVFFDYLGKSSVPAGPDFYTTVGQAIIQTPFLQEIYNHRAYVDASRPDAIKALRGSYVHALSQIRFAGRQAAPCREVELTSDDLEQERIVVGATSGERNELALPPMTHHCFKFMVKGAAFDSEKNCVKLSLREVDQAGAEKPTDQRDVLQLLGQGQGTIAGLPNAHIYLRQRELTADLFNLEPTPQSMSKRRFQIAAELTSSCKPPEPETPAPSVCRQNRIRCEMKTARTCEALKPCTVTRTCLFPCLNCWTGPGISCCCTTDQICPPPTTTEFPVSTACFFEVRADSTSDKWIRVAGCRAGECFLSQDNSSFDYVPSLGPECSHLNLDPSQFSHVWSQIRFNPATLQTSYPKNLVQVAKGVNCQETSEYFSGVPHTINTYQYVHNASTPVPQEGCAGDAKFCRVIYLGAK